MSQNAKIALSSAAPWAIYCRVSTEDQAHGGVSLDAQLAACRAWAQLKGVAVAEEIIDAGHSAKSLRRPGMERMLVMIREGALAGVIAWRLDRLTRSIRDLVMLLDLLGEQKGLVSASENLDTTSAMGRFTVHLLGCIAQWERETIGDRTRMARRHVRSMGYFAGGAVPPGLAVEAAGERRRLVVGPHAEAVAAMWPMVLEGRSMRDIAIAMEAAGVPGSWSTVRVNNLLKSSQYLGLLVDEQTRAAVMARLADRDNPRRRRAAEGEPRASERISPLKGMLRCPQCGAAMIQVLAHGRSKAYPYFRCCRRTKRLCRQTDIRAEPLEAQVFAAVLEAVESGAYRAAVEAELAPLRGAGKDLAERRAVLQAEADQLASRLRDLGLHGPRAGSPAYRRLVEPLAERCNAVEMEIAGLDGSLAAIETDRVGAEWAQERIAAALAALRAHGGADTPEDFSGPCRDLLTAMVRSVTPRPDGTALEMYLPGNANAPAGKGEGVRGSFMNAIWLSKMSGKRTVTVRVGRPAAYCRAR